MGFGEQLRRRRKELGYSREELAQKLGITGSAVGNYETGVSAPRESVLLRLFDVLQVEPNYLYRDFYAAGRRGEGVSSEEASLLRKYRELGLTARQTLCTMLDALGEQKTLSEIRQMGALAAPYPFVLYSDLYDHRDFIRGQVNAGFSGLLWTPEFRQAETKEECIRRIQCLVFSCQFLINSWNYDGIPWVIFDCEEEVRELIHLRYRLIPMLKKAFDVYHATGKPPIRALVMDFTQDEMTYAVDDEYLFCEDLLVAPIAADTGDRRDVYLPREARWADFYTGEEIVLPEDGILHVETKGIPFALMVARALGVQLVIARRDHKAFEGSVVTINYISGAGGEMKTMSLAKRAVRPGQKALIVDDFTKDGGTVRGMVELMQEFDVTTVGVGVMVERRKEGAPRIYDDIRSLFVVSDAMDAQQGAVVRPAAWLSENN